MSMQQPSARPHSNDISYVVRDSSLDGQMTSTPPKSVDLKGKGKEHSVEAEEQRVPVTQPVVIDETIFHKKKKPQKMPSPLYGRS